MVQIDYLKSLATIRPDLATEWHPDKNKELTPYDVTSRTRTKVWWQCRKGHEWYAAINNRYYGTGCPKCKEYLQTSFPEKTIFYYLSMVFPNIQSRYSYQTERKSVEIDIFIEELKLGIEYDGYYHKFEKSIKNDESKNVLLQNNIQLIRIRESGLPIIKNYNCFFYKRLNNSIQSLEASVLFVFNYIRSNLALSTEVERKISNIHINIESDRANIYDLIEYEEKQNSLYIKRPDLAQEWHRVKNKNLKPIHLGSSSNIKVWWICAKGHEWQDTVNNRNRGDGCPYCSGHRACVDNCLNTIRPDLVKEWHTLKNGSLTSNDVVPNSHKKVWWICAKGHEWKANIGDRNIGEGCPFCSGKRICNDNCLSTLNPDLAKEWHPDRNGKITAYDVTCFSSTKIWWICSKGHEWIELVSNRSRGNGCPYCSGRRVNNDNCLAVLNSDLAKEWNPIKNGSLTPFKVTCNSGIKVWWKCQVGHEWRAVIGERNKGSGCPFCSGRYTTDDNCLAVVNPELANQWHYTKNVSITARDVKAFSNKKVWWKCTQGHEWEATISSRSSGTGCPYCSNQRVSQTNCLATQNPELAKQWHLLKNGTLTPYDVIAGSEAKVWWKCSKGHEWEAAISCRNNGTGCPYCKGNKVCSDNCLSTLNPSLEKEWHPTRNGSLTPADVTLHSNKKVWWICKNGHEWQATINNRSNGRGCAICSGKRKNINNIL